MTTLRQPAPAFTLVELLVVIAIIALLVSILLPSLAQARDSARGARCLSNQRQIGIAARLYMDSNGGGLFHHHEWWVLDDGSQVQTLPTTPAACAGGGVGNSQAEKPWVIFFQPFMDGRLGAFCPSDPTPRSMVLATDIIAYNGGITDQTQTPPPTSEQAIAAAQGLTIESYLLNSVFTHKSARYAVEHALSGFATDAASLNIVNHNLIMFSERNSEALDALDNSAFGAVDQDDYDTWDGEAALVQWGTAAGSYADQGWIRPARHGTKSNYVFQDGHAQTLSWTKARALQYPDLVVRKPLPNPPR